MQARLKVFYEEELDVPLVLFNEVLDHVLRIDRIFKQNQVCMFDFCSPHYIMAGTNYTVSHSVSHALRLGRSLHALFYTKSVISVEFYAHDDHIFFPQLREIMMMP